MMWRRQFLQALLLGVAAPALARASALLPESSPLWPVATGASVRPGQYVVSCYLKRLNGEWERYSRALEPHEITEDGFTFTVDTGPGVVEMTQAQLEFVRTSPV